MLSQTRMIEVICNYLVKENVLKFLRLTSEEALTHQSLTHTGRTTRASIVRSIPNLAHSKLNIVESDQTQVLLEQEICYRAISGLQMSKQKLIKF